MNILKRKLIIESPLYDIEPVMEKTNRDSEPRLHVTGHYIMLDETNKNKRKYKSEDTVPAIEQFKREMIDTGRAGGTLNHESSADVDLTKLCHKIISLERDEKRPNLYIGKSVVLSTPSGKIYESLLNDGLRTGMSTRMLGQVIEESGISVVKAPVLISVDSVYDPSIGGALGDKDVGFVNGILENKEYIISDDGKIAEAYDKLEKNLAKYPSRHRDAINAHILESFKRFLSSI